VLACLGDRRARRDGGVGAGRHLVEARRRIVAQRARGPAAGRQQHIFGRVSVGRGSRRGQIALAVIGGRDRAAGGELVEAVGGVVAVLIIMRSPGIGIAGADVGDDLACRVAGECLAEIVGSAGAVT
jgi:hypothetical protein